MPGKLKEKGIFSLYLTCVIKRLTYFMTSSDEPVHYLDRRLWFVGEAAPALCTFQNAKS